MTLLVAVLVAGDSVSLLTIKSASGKCLRPDGILRDKDGFRVLAKVRDQASWLG
jgi:hypothetical protein